MAGFLRYGKLLLFSNPYSLERKNLTLQISKDDGKTWSQRETIERGWSAYSDIASARDRTILLLYERGKPAEALTLARVKGLD
jgi:sialidase-1